VQQRAGRFRRAGALAAALSLRTFIPIPMYTTVPNEGSTYGIMPVFMSIGDTGAVTWIMAPSVSWNKAAGVNGTFRYYVYPSAVRTFSAVAAASTHVNRTLWLTYDDLTAEPGEPTVESVAMVRRNIFYRFFGLGPDAPQSAESSYTRLTGLLTSRIGLNLRGHFNAGARVTVRGDRPERNAIFGLPLLQDAHPDAPGIDGAALGSLALSLRYDTRPNGNYSEDGTLVDVSGSYNGGLRGFGHFWQFAVDVRGLWRETDWSHTAFRATFSREWDGSGIPFYYQSTLGGEIFLRGFPEGRFYDAGAWAVDIEQRLRMFQTHLFRVVADWRIDPFVTVGQVFGDWADLASHVRVGGGLGLRAWVRPNVVGRVDVAYAGEGVRAYVVLGYPY
jgi:hypothetical protein